MTAMHTHQDATQQQPQQQPHPITPTVSSPTTPQRLQHLDSILIAYLNDENKELVDWLTKLDHALDLRYTGPPKPARPLRAAASSRRSKRPKFNPPQTTQAQRNDNEKPDPLAYRLARLSEFLHDPSFGHLLSDLAEDVDALPQCFVDCIFVVSTSTGETVVKDLVDHNVLLTQLDKLKCHTHTTPRKQRLQTLLEHAFIDKKLGRTVDESLILEHSTSSDFAGAFNGPALMLLHDHLIVHNSLFPALKPPERVHAIATPVNDAEDEDGTLTKTHEYYAKVLPILQSSGFGKTRMCVQLGTRHPGMLVCLRHSHHSDRHRISFPPQDATVYDYFIKVTSAIATLHTPEGGLKIPVTSAEHKAFNDGHLRIIAWLAVYCNTLVHYLEQLKHDSGCFPAQEDCGATSVRHYPESCWRTVVYCFAHATSFEQHDFSQIPEGLCRHSRLMERLSWPSISTTATTSRISGNSSISKSIDEAGKTANLAPPALIGTPDLRNKILDHICTLADTRYKAMLTEYASVLDDDNMPIRAIHHHLIDPIVALENLSPKEAVQTFGFLALDECSSIATILPLIRRVWFHASPLSTWILLVDTNSSLAPLAGTAARTTSRRPSEYETHRLSQPFSAMPLDVKLDMLIGRAPPTRIDNPLAAAKQAPSDDESHHHGLPSELVAWAERTWLNFKHFVRLPKQVPHDAKTIGPGLLVELWFRHAAAQGIVNQPGWDFLIPVYETDDLSAPSGDHIFDKHRLSYVAIQVKNSLQRPGVETLKANVGPKVQVAEGKSKHCLELFIDLRAQGHDCIYTRRPSLPTPPTLPETAQELVRHHVRMGSSALCVLDRLKTPAKDQVGMLFGNADSLDTLEFDDEHAKYVRQLTDRHEHQSAWADAQTRVQGALVSVTEQPD